MRTRPRGINELADRSARRHVGVVLGTLDLASDATEIEGRGRLRRHENSPPGPDTLFEIGSITKTFTSLALAVLVGSGTVSLRTPLRDLLPAGTAVPRRDHSEITLEHLDGTPPVYPARRTPSPRTSGWPTSAGRTPTT